MKTWRNTSKYATEDRREYIDNLYIRYASACRKGDKERKFALKKKLQSEGVNSYDYYSKESFIAFSLGIVAIVVVIVLAVVI